MHPTKLRGKIEAIQANSTKREALRQSIQAVPKRECISTGNKLDQEIEMKLKIYVLTVSRYFPSTHPRKGEETHFEGKICRVLEDYLQEKHGRHAILSIKDKYSIQGWWELSFKIHTIRSNYNLWEKRIKEVQQGKAILSLRYWSGKPYNSKQVEFACLDKDSGIGIQKLGFEDNELDNPVIFAPFDDDFLGNIELVAKNDGLGLVDFKTWFKGYDLSKPMAIIHFTSSRY